MYTRLVQLWQLAVFRSFGRAQICFIYTRIGIGRCRRGPQGGERIFAAELSSTKAGELSRGQIEIPPSTGRTTPVMYPASSEARKAVVAAISLGAANRPSGMAAASS